MARKGPKQVVKFFWKSKEVVKLRLQITYV
jgi:hypothetical protein